MATAGTTMLSSLPLFSLLLFFLVAQSFFVVAFVPTAVMALFLFALFLIVAMSVAARRAAVTVVMSGFVVPITYFGLPFVFNVVTVAIVIHCIISFLRSFFVAEQQFYSLFVLIDPLMAIITAAF